MPPAVCWVTCVNTKRETSTISWIGKFPGNWSLFCQRHSLQVCLLRNLDNLLSILHIILRAGALTCATESNNAENERKNEVIFGTTNMLSLGRLEPHWGLNAARGLLCWPSWDYCGGWWQGWVNLFPGIKRPGDTEVFQQTEAPIFLHLYNKWFLFSNMSQWCLNHCN